MLTALKFPYIPFLPQNISHLFCHFALVFFFFSSCLYQYISCSALHANNLELFKLNYTRTFGFIALLSVDDSYR